MLAIGELAIFFATRRIGVRSFELRLPQALIREAAKWGMFITTIVFVVLLNDRIAETMGALSVAIWALLNWVASRYT